MKINNFVSINLCILSIFFLGSCSSIDKDSRQSNIVADFTNHYIESDPRRPFFTKFLGIESWQNPMDLWSTQEIITEVLPDFIVETGTAKGGTALYYANILDSLGLKSSKVITIDIRQSIPEHINKINNKTLRKRAQYLFDKYIIAIKSNSVSPELLKKIEAKVKNKTTLVTLDSCHNSLHVKKELALYSPLVSKGSYLIVQDTIIDDKEDWVYKYASCSGYPDAGGPGLALSAFLINNKNFEVDKTREKFLLTFYRNGYLKKISK